MSLLTNAVDRQAVGLTAQEIAYWFDVTTPQQLAEYGVSQTDVSAMLPMTLQIPPVVQKMSRWTLVPYLHALLHSPRKAEMYDQIMVALSQRYYWHCLVMCHGHKDAPPGSPLAQLVLQHFPVLGSISSLQPWYHANMDRVLARLIVQLEGAGEQVGSKPADRAGDTGRSPDSGGTGDGGLLPGQVGGFGNDMAIPVPIGQWDGGYCSDPD